MTNHSCRAKLAQRYETFVSEKKETQQEQTKLKYEKDNSVKQLKKSQVQMDIVVESVKVSYYTGSRWFHLSSIGTFIN